MASSRCRVSFTDSEGILHGVGVDAESLYEVTGTVMRREHDFEHARYVIAWDDGGQGEIWPNEDPALEERLELWRPQ